MPVIECAQSGPPIGPVQVVGRQRVPEYFRALASQWVGQLPPILGKTPPASWEETPSVSRCTTGELGDYNKNNNSESVF
jgi:hypothetical protein